MKYKKICFSLLLFSLFFFIANPSPSQANIQQEEPLKVGVAGTAPFVTNIDRQSGISLQIWQNVAGMRNVQYKLVPYGDAVDSALTDLANGNLDVVVGPISITAKRAKKVQFTQPYYQSSLSIMSRVNSPAVWEIILSFFNIQFLFAVLGFLFILACVGTLFWLAEHEQNPDEFDQRPLYGIPDGMWCAIVTMTTTGYGDISPRTLWGRITAGCWMIICIVFATTMIAGIAGTLSQAMSSNKTITKAGQLTHKKVAVIKGSPAEDFIKQYGANPVYEKSLKAAYHALKNKEVAAVVYDRPQMLYFLDKHPGEGIAVSKNRYVRQGYGFATPLNRQKSQWIDINLLKLQKSGQVERIISQWLGKNG